MSNDRSGEAVPKAQAAALPNIKPCKRCDGKGFVDDGEITHSAGGIPYENGPVKSIKDCPDCTGRNVFATQPAPQGVPDGWKLVPETISEEMHIAASKVLLRCNGLDGTPQRMLDAMLAAAPAAPQAGPQQWIDDPHDIEQGRMLNPEWLKLHGLTANQAFEADRAACAAPTQVDAGAETGARAALFDAQHAIQDLLSWDAQRGFPLTYKVRDPLHVVLRSCLDALAAQGGQEAEPVAKIVMNRYGGKKTEWFDAQEAAEMPVGTLIYARPPRTQGYVPTRGYSLSAIDAETVARALERVARLDAGNGMYAKPGNQPEWKIARKLWTFLKHGQQGDAQADADKLDFMERQRVLVAPEYEGQWEALVYGDQEKPSIKGTGNTPRAAIADAIARQNGKDGAA